MSKASPHEPITIKRIVLNTILMLFGALIVTIALALVINDRGAMLAKIFPILQDPAKLMTAVETLSYIVFFCSGISTVSFLMRENLRRSWTWIMIGKSSSVLIYCTLFMLAYDHIIALVANLAILGACLCLAYAAYKTSPNRFA